MEEFVVKYWLQVLFSGVLSAVGFILTRLIKEFKKERHERELVNLGVQALLRDRLIQSYNFHIEKGYCPVHDRDNILNMYKQYHTLGANGVIDSLMDDLLELPVKISQEV